MPPTLLSSASAGRRLDAAQEWLLARAPAEEVLVVAASADAANDLLRRSAARVGASFGWHRATLPRLAAWLATPELVAGGLTPVGALAVEAVVARLVHRLAESDGLGRYADVAAGPGFARALARTLAEVRLAGLAASLLAERAPEVAALLEAYERELAGSGFADRAEVLSQAARSADRSSPHLLLELPTLLLDVTLATQAERAFISAIAQRAPELIATVPAGDAISQTSLESALGVRAQVLDVEPSRDPPALRRLQAHLFEEAAPESAGADEGVVIFSAPGESRECVEIARRLIAAAGQGVPFDCMAVLLRSADEYRPHLEEALSRAGIPAHFARGAVRADPGGRAFLALLRCRTEGLSARRFAEYLSLGEVPSASEQGAPPPPLAPADRWVPPDGELVPERVAEALEQGVHPAAEAPDADREEVASVAPRHWEQLLGEAAVIGGWGRWERRLSGLASKLRLDQDALDDAEGPRAAAIRRDLAGLEKLRDFALPLLDVLEALPRDASWGDWLDRLSALASRALRRPDRVLSVLAELAPMAPVGPVSIDEVVLVLRSRLLEVALPPASARYGRVFVAPAEAARGMAFDLVFVPGLAEKLFPRRVAEEPILLDEVRSTLGAGLLTNEERIARERLALRLAVGAARRQVVLSYPRLDLDQGRPRVPSFYALEALRAAEGRLPGFDELAGRAERIGDARVGWPAPREPSAAIDEAEHDLALLERLLRLEPERSVGTARFLLSANPHLGRALRFRARRWLRRWTPAD
ncbi:MAG: PD-(D/E)XK nuclease family protein, partial [Myxococcota bacterium]